MENKTTNIISGDAAFAVDRRQVIVSWNSEAEKLFNLEASSVLGRRCYNVVGGKDLYGNCYCCKKCPLMRMASKHESVHSFPLFLKTGSNQLKKTTLHSLTVFGSNGEEQLLHLFNGFEEHQEHQEHQDNGYSTYHNGNTRPSANHHRGGLTCREIEVLSLLAEGKSTRGIASLMCISPATVRNHIQHTMYKLHVHTRLEAVVKANHLNLVSD